MADKDMVGDLQSYDWDPEDGTLTAIKHGKAAATYTDASHHIGGGGKIGQPDVISALVSTRNDMGPAGPAFYKSKT